MTITRPVQAEGYNETHLQSSVMGALRFIRDDTKLTAMRPGKQRSEYLDSIMSDFAGHCGVTGTDFKEYVRNLLTLR